MSLIRHSTIPTIRLAPLAARIIGIWSAITAGASLLRRAALPLGFLALIAGWLAVFLIQGLRDAVTFDGGLADGPHQLFNPLRRIAAGQRGGADFQFFHGVGVPYLHYPLYVLFGQTIHASELARAWVEAFQMVIGFLVVFAAATRRLTPALGLTAAALIVTNMLSMVHLALPINSLIGLRSVTPVLVVGLLLAGVRPSREAIGCGLLTAVAVLLGTEFGVATALMLGLTWAGRRWFRLPGGSLRWLLLTGVTFAAALAGLLLLICGPEGVKLALRYALRDLPADQMWYFGAPPNAFVCMWRDLLDRDLWLDAIGPVLVTFAAAASAVRWHPAARPAGVVLLAALAAVSFSTVGYLGYTSMHYLLPAERMALIVGLIGLWHAWRWMATDSALAVVALRVGRVTAAALTVMWLVAGSTPWTILKLPVFVGQGRTHAADLIGGRARLSPRLADHVGELAAAIDADRAAVGITRPPVIWSTYAGLLEARYGVFHPHCDYIIHARGPDALERYVAAFRIANPDYVVTLRRDTFPYEGQHQDGGWPFYEEVVLNYDVRTFTKEAVLWKRRPDAWKTPDLSERIAYAPRSAEEFATPLPPGVPPDTPLVVEVEYEVRNPVAGVPVIGGMPRYLIAASGSRNTLPVSLPPYRNNWSFAVYPIPGQTPTFYAGTFSLVGGSVSIKRVHVRPLRSEGRERPLWERAPPEKPTP